MPELQNIGTVEVVSLPSEAIDAIPAKIDTGADGSAIWASRVKLKNGRLVFRFFAPGSVFYNGKAIKTENFKTTSVKNSFGQEEFRFKIKLRVKLGGRVATRWFSLADRSNTAYPILLGKNFLKNRFIVDVSKKHAVKSGKVKPHQVLVLGSAPKLSDSFFKKVSLSNLQAVNYICSGYDSLVFYIGKETPHVINTTDSDRDIALYGLIYFKSHNKHAEFAAAIAEYLRYKARTYIDGEVGHYTSMTKLTQYMKLACHGLPVPKTVVATTPWLYNNFATIEEFLKKPFVLKEIGSDRGRNNYLIKDQGDFEKVLKAAPKEHVYLAQEYIKNDGYLRTYVFGNESGLVVKRNPHPHANQLKTHLNNPAGGVNASLVKSDELSGEIRDIAIRATTCLNRQIAGVDIVRDKQTNKCYILEVNNGPQIRSGSFIPEKVKAVARFFDNALGK